VREPAVAHRVRMKVFWRWLDTQGKTPTERTMVRQKLMEILTKPE
jgi:hypothetical protein